jgi:thymidylate synthase
MPLSCLLGYPRNIDEATKFGEVGHSALCPFQRRNPISQSQMMGTANMEEKQYLDLIQKVLQQGETRDDRTGTGTMSIFAPPQMRFQLNTFPLLTTKKMFLRGIFEELIWFIQGNTDSRVLSNKNVKIWDANQLEAQERLGYAPGDLGPIYGFQWRHFGADYKGLEQDYKGQGVDQLANVFRDIIYNPTSRRIILSAWNPFGTSRIKLALSKMALPPCHIFCQFYVSQA